MSSYGDGCISANDRLQFDQLIVLQSLNGRLDAKLDVRMHLDPDLNDGDVVSSLLLVDENSYPLNLPELVDTFRKLGLTGGLFAVTMSAERIKALANFVPCPHYCLTF